MAQASLAERPHPRFYGTFPQSARSGTRLPFAASNQLPAGIDRVLVNGVEVVSGGAWNGATAGRVLLRGIQG
jgi:hypothetical protein